jgi:DUF2933 family protein
MHGEFDWALAVRIYCALVPLMMLFMMRGMMGGHGKHDGHAPTNTESDPSTSTSLAAMEGEVTRLRGELDAASGMETVAGARNDGRR